MTHANLLKCSEEHRYQRNALNTAIAAYEALPPVQKRVADDIYRGLLVERTLPVRKDADK